MCWDLWGPVRSHNTRGRGGGGTRGKLLSTWRLRLSSTASPGCPAGWGEPRPYLWGAGSAALRPRGAREGRREGEPRCADGGKGGTGGPAAALRALPARSGSAELRRDPSPKPGESFPKLWRRGPVPPQRPPHSAPPSAAVPAPAAGRGGRCSRLRAAFSRSPPAPRASSLLRASGSLRRSRRWGFFTSPTPIASSRLSRPKPRGECGKGNASPTLFL